MTEDISAISALADPDYRDIMLIGEPMTTRELSTELDIPESTAYRKAKTLSDSGLLEEGTRLQPGSRNPTTYEPAFNSILVVASPGSDTIDVTIHTGDDSGGDDAC